MFDAPHLGFVVASYAISAVVLAGLVIETVLRTRRYKRQADEKTRNRSA